MSTTYEFKGYLEHNDQEYKYELLRSQETTEGAKIALPLIDGAELKAMYETNN